MLVDKNDSNILPLLGKGLECPLNFGCFGLRVNDKEVALRIRRIGDVLYTELISVRRELWIEEEVSRFRAMGYILRYPPGEDRSLSYNGEVNIWLTLYTSFEILDLGLTLHRQSRQGIGDPGDKSELIQLSEGCRWQVPGGYFTLYVADEAAMMIEIKKASEYKPKQGRATKSLHTDCLGDSRVGLGP